MSDSLAQLGKHWNKNVRVLGSSPTWDWLYISWINKPGYPSKNKKSYFLKNIEIPLETMPKNEILRVSLKEQNTGSFKKKFFFSNWKFIMADCSNCCFGPEFSQEKISEDWTIKILWKLAELKRIKRSLIWVEEIPWKITEPELFNKTLLPWLQRKEIIKTKFYLFKPLMDMKVTFSESLNILSWANVEKTFLNCKNHVF